MKPPPIVDPENEDRLQKAIEALTRDKTILMIAHRLKTVRNADQILVLGRRTDRSAGHPQPAHGSGGACIKRSYLAVRVRSVEALSGETPKSSGKKECRHRVHSGGGTPVVSGRLRLRG